MLQYLLYTYIEDIEQRPENSKMLQSASYVASAVQLGSGFAVRLLLLRKKAVCPFPVPRSYFIMCSCSGLLALVMCTSFL
ncbi:hypothetical protein QYF36_017381 [Acer negundo]|nr:hypothetical protein QYF36_017381 [Acer negundo]